MGPRNFGVERRRGERGSGAPWGWVVVGSGEEKVIREKVCPGVLREFLDKLRLKPFLVQIFWF